MYTVCPKCGHRRQADDSSDRDVCPACGILFSKWMKQQFTPRKELLARTRRRTDGVDGRWMRFYGLVREIWHTRIVFIEAPVRSSVYTGRVCLWILLLYLGCHYITTNFRGQLFSEQPLSGWLGAFHLAFHEAGHLVFSPFGDFLHILGGSLGQLIVPGFLIGYFLHRCNPFAASIGLWLLAHSFMDMSLYIDDAIAQQLMLTTGHTGADLPGTHDWNNLLTMLGRLDKTPVYASFSYTVGNLLMLLAFVWGAYLLYRQRREIV